MLLSPRAGGGGFQSASPPVSCSVGSGSNVDQEMVEELRSFPAHSHRVNQPQRREEMLLTSFPPGAQGSQVKQGRRVASSA